MSNGADQEKDGENQQHDRREQQPDQDERDPKHESRTDSVAETDDGPKRNHLRASISRMASAAVISPRFRRSRISVWDGVGSVSTNSRLDAIRVRRDLIVG